MPVTDPKKRPAPRAAKPRVRQPRHEESTAPGPIVDDRTRSLLAQAFTPAWSDIDPVPWATVEQARRLGAVKAELLRSGAFTYKALAQGWDARVETARQRVARARERNELFTVTHDGETIVPAFLLDSTMNLRPELHAPIAVLRDAGEDGWALWAWFTQPSAWLDGAVPSDLAHGDAEQVAAAATRRAAAAG